MFWKGTLVMFYRWMFWHKCEQAAKCWAEVRTGITRYLPGSRAILANSSRSSSNDGRLSASNIQPKPPQTHTQARAMTAAQFAHRQRHNNQKIIKHKISWSLLPVLNIWDTLLLTMSMMIKTCRGKWELCLHTQTFWPVGSVHVLLPLN